MLYKRGEWWWCRFQVRGVETRRSLKSKSHKAALREANRLHGRALAGLPLDEDEAEEAPTVTACLVDYEAELIRRGSSAKHVSHSISYLARAIKDAGAETMYDLDTPALERAVGVLSDRSSRTQNKVIGYLQAWFRWLGKTGRWTSNTAAALARVKHREAKAPRRSLSPAELKALVTSDFIPECRQLVYEVAASTGLRRNELNSLRWGDVDLERAEVTTRAAVSKNNKTVTLPIPQELAERWKAWAESPEVLWLDDIYIWPDPLPPCPDLRTLRKDCEWVGIPLETSEGRLDFHALRVTFGSRLARADVGFAMAVKLMRHSDPKLTAGVYARFAADDRRAAVEKMAAAEKPEPSQNPAQNPEPKSETA